MGKENKSKAMSFRWIVLLLFCGVTMQSYAFAQLGKTVVFKHKMLTLDQLFNQIASQAGYRFFYSNDELDVRRNVNLPALELKLEDALKIGLQDEYSFRIQDNNIVISVAPPQTKIQAPESVRISGKVTDANKSPLPGVTVILEGTSLGTLTDADGKYTLTIPKSDNIRLRFSFIGMKSEFKIYKGEKELNVVLLEESTEMEEVVVTGMFDKPRESYTGAVTTVTSRELKMFKGQNLLQTLRNIDPAINIVQDNVAGSNPNNLPELNIRGNSSLPTSIKELNEGVSSQLNTPLIIMDGFEISLRQLIDLNDDQVQSINIMKDASATAIYGSRGANGVIVITTKRPQTGKLQVYVSAGLNIEIPDLTSYDLLNALEKLDFEYRMGLYSSDRPAEDLTKRKQYYDLRRDVLGGVNTYWLSQPLRTGVGQSYNLKLEGGTEEFRWSFDGNYNETIGVMKNSDRKVFGGSINLTYRKNQFTFQNQTRYNYTRGDESDYGSFYQYVRMNPYWRVRDDEGKLIAYYTYGNGRTEYNPLYDTQFGNKDYVVTHNVADNLSAEWRPIDGFIVRGKIGLSKSFNNHDVFKSPNSSYFFNQSTEFSKRGSYVYTTGQSFSVDGNLTLSYAKTFNDVHQVYFGFDFSAAQNESYSYSFTMRGYNDRYDFLPNAIGFEKDGKPSGTESTTRRAGYTANVNYTFRNSYYADLSFRMDGSSQFGTNKRFAPFWSVGIGWNMHNEEFVKRADFINNLQVRMSYGVTGSQNFESYMALTSYEYDVNDRYIFSTPANLMGYGNDNLKWQQTVMTNVGLNFSLFDRRITGSMDYYLSKTDKLLSSRTIAASTGFSSIMDNIGKVQNSGLELMLSGYPIRSPKGFSWMIMGKIAQNKNKILELSPEIKRQTEEYAENNVELPSLMYEGESNTAIYAVKSLGIDPSTGQELFYDKDGNITYTWNANAKVLVGNTQPKFRGNLSSNFRYKGLSFNLSFAYHWGGQQYNSTLIQRVEVPLSSLNQNLDRRVLEDRWYYPGQRTFYKSFYDLNGDPATTTKASSRFVQDDNMFSLQSASLSYQFTGGWVQKANLRSLEFGVNVSDLFYVSTIKRERGTSYPFSRHLSCSLKLYF